MILFKLMIFIMPTVPEDNNQCSGIALNSQTGIRSQIFSFILRVIAVSSVS